MAVPKESVFQALAAMYRSNSSSCVGCSPQTPFQ